MICSMLGNYTILLQCIIAGCTSFHDPKNNSEEVTFKLKPMDKKCQSSIVKGKNIPKYVHREWKHVIKSLPFKKCYSLIQKLYTRLADFYSNIADIVSASMKHVSQQDKIKEPLLKSRGQ